MAPVLVCTHCVYTQLPASNLDETVARSYMYPDVSAETLAVLAYVLVYRVLNLVLQYLERAVYRQRYTCDTAVCLEY
jgi:hypothetical protein